MGKISLFIDGTQIQAEEGMLLHRRCAKTCTIDFNTQEGEKVFFEWIDFLQQPNVYI